MNSIIYQLPICRQKTINISPFEAHFGRKANTPLTNISTEPDPSTLKNNAILKKIFIHGDSSLGRVNLGGAMGH